MPRAAPTFPLTRQVLGALKRTLLSCGILLALAAPAFAQTDPPGIDLAWNDCVQGPYTADMPNACNSNTGSMTMFASFVPPGLLLHYEGNTSIIDLATSASVLSAWWHLETGGCRDGSLSISGDFTSGPLSCSDFWNGRALGGYEYVTPSPGCSYPNTARIRTTMAVPESLAGPIDNSTMWYAFKLSINRARTVGTGSCAGCLDPAYIVLNQMNLSQPAPEPDVILTTTGVQNTVTYRGGLGPHPHCVEPTPTHRNTWGSLKALYR